MSEIGNFARSELEKAKEIKEQDFLEVLIEPAQSSLRNAILADLIDAVPVIGDASNIARVGRIFQEMETLDKGRERRGVRLEGIIEASSLREVVSAVDKSLKSFGHEAREFRRRRGPMQVFDAAIGLVPGLGAAADILTPTNTIGYLASTKKREIYLTEKK